MQELITYLASPWNSEVNIEAEFSDFSPAFLSSEICVIILDVNCVSVSTPDFQAKLKHLKSSLSSIVIFTGKVEQHESEGIWLTAIQSGADEFISQNADLNYWQTKLGLLVENLTSKIALSQVQKRQSEHIAFADSLLVQNVESRNFGRHKIKTLQLKAADYVRDIYFCAQCPNGDINALLGSFYGGATDYTYIITPLAETFRTMTRKGFTLNVIIQQLNTQLYQLLPDDGYLSLVAINLSSQNRRIQGINLSGGRALLVTESGMIKSVITPQPGFLGVKPHIKQEALTQIIECDATDKLLLVSGGLIETIEAHLLQVFNQVEKGEDISPYIAQYIQSNSVNLRFDQDMSFIEIPCEDWEELFTLEEYMEEGDTSFQSNLEEFSEPDWEFSYRLEGQNLAQINPIPSLLNMIKDTENHEEHWQNLYTILTELYENALLHGILNIKAHPEYRYESRNDVKNSLLKTIDAGFINFTIQYYRFNKQGIYKVFVSDSGEGFDYENFLLLQSEINEARGIFLLQQLCQQIVFHEKGALVEAHYYCVNVN